MKKIQSSVLEKLNVIGCFVANSEDWQSYGDQTWTEMVQLLLQRPPAQRVVGVDAEWFLKNPLAVVQFSTQTHCIVLHLSYFTDRQLPPPVKSLLSDKTIIKCGVGASGDRKRIFGEQKCEVQPVMDVEHFAAWLGIAEVGQMNLQALTNHLENIWIEKDKHITRSNWELPLVEEQKSYCAEDAVASWAIGQHVLARLGEKYPEALSDMCGFLERKKMMAARAYKAAAKARMIAQKEKQQQEKEAAEGEASGGPSLTKFMQYGGDGKVKVLSRDGKFMFECSNGKAKYYVQEKNIATIVEHCPNNPRKPKVIQFSFDPKVKTRLCMFYRLDKCELGEDCPFAHGVEQLTPEAREMIHTTVPSCACCLGTKDLMRFSIVPPSYRRFFPKTAQKTKKNGNIENFVPICHQCHTFVQRLRDDQMHIVKQQCKSRAAELHYPKSVLNTAKSGKCISYARLLLDEGKLTKLPQERQEYLSAFIARYWPCTHLNELTKDGYGVTGSLTPAEVRTNRMFLEHLASLVPGDVQAKVMMDILLRALPNPKASETAPTPIGEPTADEDDDKEWEEVEQLALADDTDPSVLERTAAMEAMWKDFCLRVAA
ncbi:3-5 exonuclease [Angomonas deanei]|uniref:3'-5' exonuclease n=1 Tax=Angomonas deanei TaxID=59799 RepID=A0A7G2CRK3_9TRYP|nr:3-5 exonuclease [Angomonas deanei]CAD2222145.1 3'-5' exonuclease, putative [Angomonas deanei]|eukprot:EPY33505.1 3-5 exonuclease [Angomonas deanei]